MVTPDMGARFLYLRCLVEGCMISTGCDEKEAIKKISNYRGICMDSVEWAYLGLRWTEKNDPIAYKQMQVSGVDILTKILENKE
jgi:hypothetical protein